MLRARGCCLRKGSSTFGHEVRHPCPCPPISVSKSTLQREMNISLLFRYKCAHPVPRGWNSADTKAKRKLFVNWREDVTMPGVGAARIPVDIMAQTIFIDESAFSFHCPRKYVWGPEGERASLSVAGIRAPVQTLLLAAHQHGVIAHQLQGDFAVRPPQGEKFRGVNALLFREFLHKVCSAVLEKTAKGRLPPAAHRAVYLQADNASIHKSQLVRALFHVLERGRCFAILAKQDGMFRRHFGERSCDALRVPPRIHYVLQPPYSPFLNTCEYVSGELRRAVRAAELQKTSHFIEWMNSLLSKETPECPTREQLMRWCSHCVQGAVRISCREEEDITSNDFYSVRVLNPDIYAGGVRIAEQVVEWRMARRTAQQARRAQRATSEQDMHAEQQERAEDSASECVVQWCPCVHSPVTLTLQHQPLTCTTQKPREIPPITLGQGCAEAFKKRFSSMLLALLPFWTRWDRSSHCLGRFVKQLGMLAMSNMNKMKG